MLATNEYFSVGGGFVVNKETQTAENMYYMEIQAGDAEPSRRRMDHAAEDAAGGSGVEGEGHVRQIAQASSPGEGHGSAVNATGGQGGSTRREQGNPPYLFATAAELHKICQEQNMTIAQVVWENELAFRSAADIRAGLLKRESRTYDM